MKKLKKLFVILLAILLLTLCACQKQLPMQSALEDTTVDALTQPKNQPKSSQTQPAGTEEQQEAEYELTNEPTTTELVEEYCVLTSEQVGAVLRVPADYAEGTMTESDFELYVPTSDQTINFDSAVYFFFDATQAAYARDGLVWAITACSIEALDNVLKADQEYSDLCFDVNCHILGVDSESVYMLANIDPASSAVRQFDSNSEESVSSYYAHSEAGMEILEGFVETNQLTVPDGAVDWRAWYSQWMLEPIMHQLEAEWRVDADTLTDAYLLEIILGGEIALTRDNSFTFSDPKELSSQELYMMFLYLGSYDTFARDCLNEESGEFLFTKDYISDELSRYFKDFSLDITQTTGYDAARDVVVSMNPSGFGGDRFVNIVEKQIDGNYVTLTLDFYNNYERTGEPYQRKTYRLEFYDGGYYYLSAVVD